MVSRKDYSLDANADFVTFVISKLVTCFIDNFVLGMKFQYIVNFTKW